MIILINGASSSGKTTLARTLQELWESPLLYWSLDTVIAQLPFKYTGKGESATEGFPYKPDSSGGNEVGYGSLGLTVNELSADYLGMLADKSLDVVVDFVLLDEEILAPYRASLSNKPVLFVGLDCDPEVLAERNQNRHDRITGLSVNQQKKIHFCAEQYDLRLDSTNHSPRTLASTILSHLEHSPPTQGLC